MNNAKHILIIENDVKLRNTLSAMLSRHGYLADTAVDGAEGLSCVRNKVYDFILCDIHMPKMNGKTFLARTLEDHLSSPIIMMSNYATVDAAVECMKMGAYDFILKPFNEDEIALVLKRAEEREQLKAANSRLREAVVDKNVFNGIISHNPTMEDIFSQIRKISDLKTTVLILGESGTGKELVANAIHRSSRRANKPFRAVNCGAIPENMLEGKLFGHARGALTEATNNNAGLFEQADGGTLFLDEIGEMSFALQVKLMRVLRENEIRRVGANISHKVDVRVISATSRNLEEDSFSGRFRRDLYSRLNAFCIQLPPLRERIEDIPLLAKYFIASHAVAMERSPVRIASATLRRMMAYDWPGNIRELKKVIEEGMIKSENGLIDEGNLPIALRSYAGGLVMTEGLEENLSIKRAEEAMERNLIRKALAKAGGNRTQAAKILEISHRTLFYKLKNYGLE